MQKQQAAIYIWLIILIPVLLGLFSFLYFNSKLEMMRSKVQAVTDAAASVAAKGLCHSSECFNNIPALAKESIELQNLLGIKNIVLTESSPVFFEDTNNKIKVFMERGWWHLRDPADSESAYIFESLEDNWQGTHPGIPVYMVANSVRVKMEHTIGGLFSFSVAAPVRGETTALAGKANSDIESPFAIPVCALLNEHGKLDSSDICYGDRIFTESKRYLSEHRSIKTFGYGLTEVQEGTGNFPGCSKLDRINSFLAEYNYPDNLEMAKAEILSNFENQQYGMKPAFFYSPCSSDIPECNIRRQLNFSFAGNKDTDNEYITYGGWSNYTYANIADHYGVVGCITEIKNSLDILNCQSEQVSLGQKYYIYHNGFNYFQDYAEALWNKIKNGSNTETGSLVDSEITGKIALASKRTSGLASLPEFPLLTVLPDKAFEGEEAAVGISSSEIFNTDAPRAINPACKDNSVCYQDAKNPNCSLPAPTLLRDQFHQGLCGSRRMTLKCGENDILSGNTSSAHCGFSPEGNYLSVDQEDYTGVNALLRVANKDESAINKAWKVRIPVIADAGEDALPCDGLGEFKEEPPISENSNYIVIGFVDLNVFDMDIGDTPVHLPFSSTYYSTGGEETAVNNYGHEAQGYYEYINSFDSGGAGPNRWAFPKQCNMVRARVACNTKSIFLATDKVVFVSEAER